MENLIIKFEYDSINVSIPMNFSNCERKVFEFKDIDNEDCKIIENFFCERVEKCLVAERKINFNRARILFKYLSNFDIKIKEIIFYEQRMNVRIIFLNANQLIKFALSLQNYIDEEIKVN